MKMTLPFIGGIVHGVKMEMDWIPQVNMIVDDETRTIHAYVREEAAYFYDKDLSEGLTKVFDKVKKTFKPNPLNPVS